MEEEKQEEEEESAFAHEPEFQASQHTVSNFLQPAQRAQIDRQNFQIDDEELDDDLQEALRLSMQYRWLMS